MGQTRVQNYIHIVFATKNRIKWLDINISSDLYAYIGGICRKHNCAAVQVGGYRDHIHILCGLSKNICLSDLMRNIKGETSKWIKSKGVKYSKFKWQEGYGAFSVQYNIIEKVIFYIKNQEEHHKDKGFRKEYKQLLRMNNMEFDEKYLWS